MQRKWYRSVLEKDIDAVNGSCAISIMHTSLSSHPGLSGKKEGKTRLMNIVMQLRKGKGNNSLVGIHFTVVQ